MKKFIVLHALIAILSMISLSACAGIQSEKTVALAEENLNQTTIFEEMNKVLESKLGSPKAARNEDSDRQSFSRFSSFDETTFVNIYRRVNPSVVNIQVIRQPDVISNGGEEMPAFPNLPEMPGFPPFQLPDSPNLQPMPQQGQGSGFIYDGEGHIVTNNHVINQADEISVIFADGTEASATLVGADPDSDLAVIKVEDVEAERLVPVALADSDRLEVGQFVVAIGNPFGLTGSMTTGIVSGLGRILPAEASQFSIPDIIQTDTAINPGNSGGPLLNLDGEVVGVNTAIASPNRAFAGVGYAVPVEAVKEVVPELIENGRIQHPWLGIAGRTLDRETAEAMDLDPDQRGILIAEVVADGPAFESDLRGSDTQVTIDGQQLLIGGDVIIGIDDLVITDFDDLLSYIVHETEVGQTITMHILRDGESIDVDVTLAPRPESNP